MPRKPVSALSDHPPKRRLRGFEPAAALVVTRIRSGAESRGFAVARLLTHWAEIVGPENAARSRPVRISHGKGFGATLTLLARGADAPLLQMQLPAIRERVNAVYGFNAIARVVVTQTAATGFAEAQAAFDPGPAATSALPPEAVTQAEALSAGFADPALAEAMRRLALNTLTRRAQAARPSTHRKAMP